MAKSTLKMTFDPATIEHLGVKMYSTLPPVIAELVANASDANASNVEIHLKDERGAKQIVVTDDGAGMIFSEINSKFLRIGRNRRKEEHKQNTKSGRKIIGKKGLGKLSFFGIAKEIEIVTRKNGKENAFLMRWQDIMKSRKKEYRPTVLKRNDQCLNDSNGTTITLRGIERESDFDPEGLAIALSKLFIVDESFKIAIRHNSGEPVSVENEKKYDDLQKQVEWSIPANIGGMESTYSLRDKIQGHLIATTKPIAPKTNMRGVTLFSRKKLVNLPEYFSDSTSSHFFSYLTGWLEVDFIDDLPEDVIATDRQSLRWTHPEMMKLREYLRDLLNWLERDWRVKREQIRQKEITESTGIDARNWFSKLPDEVRGKVESVVQALVKDSELPVEIGVRAVLSFHDIVPEYPKYHWRYLHPEVQSASKQYYEEENYYMAFLEAAKRYVNASRVKAGLSSTNDERNDIEQIYQFRNPILSVTEGFKKPDGFDFSPETIKNIKEAHRNYSTGVICGGRHVVSHEEVRDLRESRLFKEEDCLDALSLLSHLFWRLDASTKVR